MGQCCIIEQQDQCLALVFSADGRFGRQATCSMVVVRCDVGMLLGVLVFMQVCVLFSRVGAGGAFILLFVAVHHSSVVLLRYGYAPGCRATWLQGWFAIIKFPACLSSCKCRQLRRCDILNHSLHAMCQSLLGVAGRIVNAAVLRPLRAPIGVA